MSNAAARLADLNQPKRSPYRIRQVVAVNSDGTVDLAWGFDETGLPATYTVPCESGYHTRAVGDVVRVLVDVPGWSVVAKVAAPPIA